MVGAVRAALIVAFLAGIVFAAGDVLVPNSGASYIPRALETTGTPDLVRVGDLSELTASGDIRSGDILRYGQPKLLLRMGALAYPARATFTNLRTGTIVALTDPAERPSSFRLREFVRLILMLTALALVVVRGRQPAVLALAAYIFLNEFALEALSGNWLGTAAALTFGTLQGFLAVVASACLVYLASTFAPKSQATNALLLLAYAGAAVFAFCELGSIAADVLYGTQWDADGHLLYVVQIALTCVALVVFVTAARAADPSDRRRILILMAATAIGSAYTLIGLFGSAFFSELQENLAVLATVIMAIGLVYAIVVEHLFDIGFVVNRAVVYAVTATFVVSAFVAIEWLVEHAAASFGHVQGAAIELALAIAVALSLRPIHKRVDAFVDGAIFAARHRAANALLRFAEDCGDFREADALLRTTLSTLRIYARTSRCAIFLAAEDGDLYAKYSDGIQIAKLGVDDPTVVRLRTSRAPVDRAGYALLTVADIAFPMLRRRSLIGAIFCSLPARAEPYSPEERDALAEVAREVGASLVALEAAAAQRLAAEVAELRARLALELS
jgi:hypothetical protein